MGKSVPNLSHYIKDIDSKRSAELFYMALNYDSWKERLETLYNPTATPKGEKTPKKMQKSDPTGTKGIEASELSKKVEAIEASAKDAGKELRGITAEGWKYVLESVTQDVRSATMLGLGRMGDTPLRNARIEFYKSLNGRC